MFLLVFYLIFAISLWPSALGQIYNNTCVLPPQPRNSSYTVHGDPGAKPGDRVHHFVLDVTCDPGFHLVGVKTNKVACIEGRYSDDAPPECIPYCQTKNPNILTCGAESCYLPDQTAKNPITTSVINNEGVECGKLPIINEQIIAGGQTVHHMEVPWHAGIYSKTFKPYMQICGGTIVSSKVIISAAHCFWKDLDKQQPAENYAVAVGKIYRPWNDQYDGHAQKSDVKEIKIPPRFQGSVTNFQEDIAMVITRDAFTFNIAVTPICLDFDYEFDTLQLQPTAIGEVAGWGLISEDGHASPILQRAFLPMISIEACIRDAPVGFTKYITGDKICAGYTNGTAVCKGDSGGGLTFQHLSNDGTRSYLRGVVSTAPKGDHHCSVQTWATFTHILKHEHFILSAMVIKTVS